ncbi:MAG: SusC/RagA family TonB-linked outer membrane protein, partial [Pseudobacter sp.]|uniref:SusC/RagA family TonB-linked outer membrane protein n=1 Tax=Pseudobacter sp. TaxID=2045420 RepID=UPI003F7E2AB7
MRKILRKQFLIPSLLFLSQAEVFGQHLQAKDTIKTVLLMNNKFRLADLAKTIKDQTQWLLVFSYLDIDAERVFYFRASELSVGRIINQIADTFGVSYSVANNAIVFKRKTKAVAYQGTVVNTKGQALSGVIVYDYYSQKNSVRSNRNGRFRFGYSIMGKRLVLTHKNFETQLFDVRNNDTFQVVMKPAWKESLVTVEVTAPKNASNRNSISRQTFTPGTLYQGIRENGSTQVQNKVPGVLIMNTNGGSGSPSRLKLRGQTNIGLEPGYINLPESNILFLVDSTIWDGPTATTRRLSYISGNTGRIGNTNPLETLNPADIENIEFLVNADATSKYGSLASNNIVSIHTKKGRPGDAINFTFYGSTGFAEAATRIRLMNTQQYFGARREALFNDGLQADSINASELIFWPADRYTDWYKFLTGNTAQVQRYYGSLKSRIGKKSGAYIGIGYNRETTVLALNRCSHNVTLQANVNHIFSKKSLLQTSLSMIYGINQLPANNPIPLSFLSPNAPFPTDDSGKLIHSDNGLNTLNIIEELQDDYIERKLVVRGALKYEQKILRGLSFLTRLTVNKNILNEVTRFPVRYYPTPTAGSSESSLTNKTTLILEKELNFYDTSRKQNIIFIQLASTLLQEYNGWTTNSYEGYASNENLGDPTVATTIITAGRKSKYHYAGLSGSFNILMQNMYSLNFTIRYNGSSRFNAANQSGFSGAVGGSIPFTKSKWIARKLPFLDYGKLHLSSGIILSDYVENGRNQTTYAYATDGSRYNNKTPLIISQYANPSLTWEKTYKNDIGIELWFRNFIFLNATWYRNVTTNQFISALYPKFTGLQSPAIINHNAEVLNTGFELSIGINKASRKGNRSFSSRISATTHRNRVQRFPGLENSLYKNTIRLNSSLSSQPVLLSKGVDPETGKHEFVDINGDGKISKPEDLVPGPDMDPLLFGGWQNKFCFKGWEFEVFIDGMIQKALNPKMAPFQSLPGSFRPDILTNLYTFYEERWKKEGDISSNQRMSATGAGGALQSFNNELSSENALVDGSFARLRLISVGYKFPRELSRTLRVKQVMVYLRAQNLCLLTKYKDGDPTQLDSFAIPSSKSLSVGFSIN